MLRKAPSSSSVLLSSLPKAMFNSNACLVADSKSHGSTGSGEPSKPNPQSENQGSGQKSVASGEGNDLKPKQKTMAEQDEELRLKLEGLSGDGGEAGVELEDGKPAAMKRSVKNNMFRLI